MSRVARVVVPGFPHHITQRGNRRADIFESDGDWKAYLRFLKRYSEKRGLDTWAYRLMSDHIYWREATVLRRDLCRAAPAGIRLGRKFSSVDLKRVNRFAP